MGHSSKQAPAYPYNPDSPIGVDPHPRPPRASAPIFETANYRFQDESRIINLPLRPDHLDKRALTKFRNILKKIVIDLESTNSNQIIAYHREADWWQCGGHSLLFYHHNLESKYRLPHIKPRPDNDFSCRWPNHGDCFMIRDINEFINNLTDKVSATLVLQSPELIILELPFSFQPYQIDSFESIKKNKEARVNTLLIPKIVAPHTRQALDELAKLTTDKVCHLTEPQRQYYGSAGVEIINSLSIRFISMCNGRIPPESYYRDALEKIDFYRDWLVHVQKFHVFDLDTLYRLATMANDVKERFKNELTKLQKEPKK